MFIIKLSSYQFPIFQKILQILLKQRLQSIKMHAYTPRKLAIDSIQMKAYA